jgi:hypothetical protein
VNEGTFTRLTRYANDVGVGVMLAVVLSAVLWTIFFTLRWVARGFKSATSEGPNVYRFPVQRRREVERGFYKPSTITARAAG